jgi:hypothetical protein
MAVGQVNFIPLYTNLIVCPLCGSPRVHRSLEAVRLSAEVDGNQVATGAVRVELSGERSRFLFA